VLSTSSTTLSNEDSAFAAFSAFDAGLNLAKKFKPAEAHKKGTGKGKGKEKEKNRLNRFVHDESYLTCIIIETEEFNANRWDK